MSTQKVTNALIESVAASKLTGALPAIDGSSLTGIEDGITKSASDPTISTNPAGGVGTVFLNTTSGEMFALTDATAGANHWINIGGGVDDIIPNVVPNEATDDMPDLEESVSTSHTFSGATDSDGTITHYIVDNISNSSLLAVTTAEVAAGSAHTFVTQSVAVDTVVTFRLRSKDNDGDYSTGITVSITVNDFVYTIATGGSITTLGDYKYHVFTGTGVFAVTTAANSGDTMDYLIVAGGGSGGTTYNTGTAGAGGAGGYRTFASQTRPVVGNYNVVIGAGGVDLTSGGQGVSGNVSSFNGASSSGGGAGGGYNGAYTAGASGGSGGGGALSNHAGAGNSGSYSPVEGYAGGGGTSYGGGGGGGAAQIGSNAAGTTGAAGGNGSNSLAAWTAAISSGGGSTYGRNTGYFAGGGGGGSRDAGPASGGLGGGGIGNTTTGQTNHAAGYVNTGSGGGGTQSNGGTLIGKNGGSGIVIIKYQYQ